MTAMYGTGIACGQPARAGRSAVHVAVRTVDADAIVGGLSAFSLIDGLVLTTPDGAERRIASEDVVRITALTTGHTEVPIQQPAPVELRLVLAGGDTLFGKIIGWDDAAEAVRVRTVDLGDMALPLDAVSAIVATTNSPQRSAISAPDRRDGAREYEDTVTLTNGDEIKGFVTAIDQKSVSVETTSGRRSVPRSVLAAVRLANDRPPPPHGLYVVVTLINSGRLTATTLHWSASVVRATLRQGPDVTIEPERIARIDVVGGRWEWLSSHNPISFQHTPMLSLGWEYGRDRAVSGGPIRVVGRLYEHGIGVHTRATLTYDLKGKYETFVTLIGLDDTAGRLADVTARIMVDGKTRYVQEGVRIGKLRGPIRIDIEGAKRIELVADYGANGDLQDRFNWVEAALIREDHAPDGG